MKEDEMKRKLLSFRVAVKAEETQPGRDTVAAMLYHRHSSIGAAPAHIRTLFPIRTFECAVNRICR